MSELSAPLLIARPGRWAALVLGMAAALLAVLGLACTSETDVTPPPITILEAQATGTPGPVKAGATLDRATPAATLPPLPPTAEPGFGNAPPTGEPAAAATSPPAGNPEATPQPIAQTLPEPLRPGGQLTAATWLDADRMYLADYAGNLRLLNVETGEIKTVLEGLSIPQGLTVLAGRLYVSEMGNACALNPTAKGKALCKPLVESSDPEKIALFAQSSARILSYRIGADGELDDQQIVVDGILSNGREHSPNGLTNDGEWIYVSIGHPFYGGPNPQGNYITAAAAELAAAGARTDLMGVIARFRPGNPEPEVYASGFRNIYGISIGPDGILYGADNDAPAGLATRGQLEELNAIVQEGFYGFPFWGSYEAGAAVGVTEPVAVLQGVASTFAYANEQGVYVAYLSLGEGAEGFVVDHFDYETFTPTRIARNAPGYITAILEREGLLYLATFSGTIIVVDPEQGAVELMERHEAGIAAAADRVIAEQEPNLSISHTLSVSYKVYWHNGELLYVQDPCGPEGMAMWFYRHIVPVNPEDLPDERSFDNLGDFRFDEYGFRRGDRCFALVPLPAYEIREISTGHVLKPRGGIIRPE